MKRFKFAVAATTVTLLAGCALQPVYHRPDSPVSAYPTGSAYATSSNQNASVAPATDIGWRNFLVDARLQQLVVLALKNNRDLRVAVLNMEKVQAQYRIQRAGLFPQVAGSVSGTSKRAAAADGNATVSRNYEADLSTAWELDFFGRLRSLSDAAREQYLASAYARQAAEILLVSQVADQYLTVLAVDEALAVTEKTLETARSSYKIVKLQFDVGSASELELRQAQTVVDQASSNHAAQVRLRAQAENALVLLVGQPLPLDLPPAVPLNEQSIVANVPAGVPSDLLTRRPDILQAESALRSENANIGAARAAFFPQITLTGTLGTASPALSGLFAAGSSVWSFVPALAVPIFNAGANQANLDVAMLQKDIGVAQYEKAIQTAFREVSDGLAARGTYDEQVTALQREVAAQKRRLDLASELYSNGVNSYLDVLTAQTDLYNAQISLTSARLNRLTGLVDLYRALGGGWIERTGDTPRPADNIQASAAAPASPSLGQAVRTGS